MNNLKLLTNALSFSAKQHSQQRRKGADQQPYINHPLEVLNILVNVGNVEDENILAAAVLHDTVEDTETSGEDIKNLFGAEICALVLEVTDDKSLPKAERKQKQIEHAAHLSIGAKTIKLADKISNIRDVTENPPHDWTDRRRMEYVEWGENVVAGLRGANKNLENYFDEIAEIAKQKFQ